MSINDQLVDDIKSVVLYDPKHMIKIIREMPNNKRDFLLHYEELICTIKEKIGDIDLDELCRLNGYTEQIETLELNIGEIILVAIQELDTNYSQEYEYGRYTVNLRSVVEKISDISYKAKIIKHSHLINRINDEYFQGIKFGPNNIEHYYAIGFHNNSWVIEYDECNWENDGYCCCEKINIFRKNPT